MADSLEVRAILKYMSDSGVAHVRSSYYCAGHSPGGYHCKAGTSGFGLAVDFQDPYPLDKPSMLAIFNAFDKVRPQLAELIYSGATYSVKDGVKVPCYAIDSHWNHVHVAVKAGTLIKWPTAPTPPPPPPPPSTVVKPMFNPPIVMPDIVASLKAPNGGVWLLGVHGEIYAFESPDYDAPNRHPEYWNLPGQTAARLEPLNGGYRVIDNAGRRYDYPAR